MVNRKRNIQMKFWVTEEEKRLIDEKMAQLPTKRYGAYLPKIRQWVLAGCACYRNPSLVFPSINTTIYSS